MVATPPPTKKPPLFVGELDTGVPFPRGTPCPLAASAPASRAATAAAVGGPAAVLLARPGSFAPNAKPAARRHECAPGARSLTPHLLGSGIVRSGVLLLTIFEFMLWPANRYGRRERRHTAALVDRHDGASIAGARLPRDVDGATLASIASKRSPENTQVRWRRRALLVWRPLGISPTRVAGPPCAHPNPRHAAARCARCRKIRRPI